MRVNENEKKSDLLQALDLNYGSAIYHLISKSREWERTGGKGGMEEDTWYYLINIMRDTTLSSMLGRTLTVVPDVTWILPWETGLAV